MSAAGTWNLQVQSPTGEMPGTLELSGEAELTGKANASIGDTVFLTGSLDGDTIELKGEMEGSQMGKIELTFSGTLDGDEMSGDVQFGSFGRGSWSATRG